MPHPLLSRLPRLTIVASDILAVEYGVIVHGCNAQGVMKSGLAAQVREKYPEVYEEYRRHMPALPPVRTDSAVGRPRTGTLPMGSISSVEVSINKWIVNATTQFAFGKDNKRYVSYDAIEIAFREVVRLIYEVTQKRGFTPTLHIPRIGAGLAGGDLRAILEIILSVVPEAIPVVLHFPVFQERT
jgi:O-acetyl-ADP-ribose deacetylase (regulator of RNase III)